MLVKRSGYGAYPYTWACPGGRAEGNETPEQAITRETKEELNFDLKDYKYVGDYSYEIEDSLKKKFHLDFDAVFCKVFITPLKNNFSKFKQKEGTRMKLFTLEDAEKLKMVCKEDIKMIRRLKKIL